MGWRADGGLWLLVRGGGLFLSKGTGVSASSFFSASSVLSRKLDKHPLTGYHFHLQIVEDFEEASVQSRGFGILDVGYRSTVTTTEMDCTYLGVPT